MEGRQVLALSIKTRQSGSTPPAAASRSPSIPADLRTSVSVCSLMLKKPTTGRHRIDIRNRIWLSPVTQTRGREST